MEPKRLLPLSLDEFAKSTAFGLATALVIATIAVVSLST
jgi:hypothetical protein